MSSSATLRYFARSFLLLRHRRNLCSDSRGRKTLKELKEYIRSLQTMYNKPLMTQGPKHPHFEMIDSDAIYARMDMPGVGKEGLKVWLELESNSLGIEGLESDKDPKFDKEIVKRVYCAFLKFPLDLALVKKDQIRAVVKNGVVRIVLPLN